MNAMWQRFRCGVRALFQKRQLDADMDEEMRSHIEMRTEEYIQRGMTPESARLAALRQFGWMESIKETCRDIRGVTSLESFCNDLRYAARMIRKNPGFNAVLVLTLALGIGGTTAVYSVINTVILNPVPGLEPDRLVQIGERFHGNKDEPRFGGVTTAAVEILQTKEEFFSDVVWHAGLHLEQHTDEFIENFYGTVVSPNFFAQWSMKPILGRIFSAEDAVRLNKRGMPENDAVMVLSYSWWQSKFGGDPSVLGRTIKAGGRQFTIVGVMPRHFQFPGGATQKFWVPATNPPPHEDAANNHLFVRLKPGVTAEQTQAMLNVVANQLLKEFPEIYDSEWHRRGGGFALLTRPLRQAFTQTPYGAANLQRTLWGLLAAIGFVLLIVCVNVANLMLARTEKRQQELAVRAAVGAGRWRLMSQLFTESVLLSCLGAVAGLAVTFCGIKILISFIPETMPRLCEIQIDGPALAATLVMSIGTALAFGLVPAWHASRASAGHALKQAGTGAMIGPAWRRYRGALVTVEVALALLLLTGAGLMLKSVVRLLQADPGFDPENVLIVHPGLLRGEKYALSDRVMDVHSALYDELHRRIAALPGVKTVGIGKIDFFQLGFTIDSSDVPIGLLPAASGVGESDLFRAMRIPLLAGRYFDQSDIGAGIGTVIVNQAMARLCWPGEEALHKEFRSKHGRAYRVIGVIGDARVGLRDRYVDPVEPTFYRPYYESAAGGGYGPFFVVRTERDPRDLISIIRDEIKAVENSMTPPWFQVARQTLYDATEAQRTYMRYLVIFAGVGLLLSAIGIYGVVAYSVARRTREIGIRIAIGAEHRHVLAMVLREAVRPVILGLGIGLLLSYWLTRLLKHQLFEVHPVDPTVLAGVLAVLVSVALLACLIPAWRAAKSNPMVALRYE